MKGIILRAHELSLNICIILHAQHHLNKSLPNHTAPTIVCIYQQWYAWNRIPTIWSIVRDWFGLSLGGTSCTLLCIYKHELQLKSNRRTLLSLNAETRWNAGNPPKTSNLLWALCKMGWAHSQLRLNPLYHTLSWNLLRITWVWREGK